MKGSFVLPFETTLYGFVIAFDELFDRAVEFIEIVRCMDRFGIDDLFGRYFVQPFPILWGRRLLVRARSPFAAFGRVEAAFLLFERIEVGSVIGIGNPEIAVVPINGNVNRLIHIEIHQRNDPLFS